MNDQKVVGGRYRLLRELGRGGMGVVFQAFDSHLDRLVALKRLFKASGTNLERLLREARSLARLRHPSVIQVYEVGSDELGPFLVMRFVEGESLEARIEREGPLKSAEATKIVWQIAEALSACHGVGILHRDVKPANVLLAPDPMLIDFGLAGNSSEAELARLPQDLQLSGFRSLTRTGALLGTPHYMAPECFSSQPPSARTDLFALGVTLYELLTGSKPYRGETLMQLLSELEKGPPPLPSTLVPELSPGLEAICMRLLASEPSDRPVSAAAVAESLARLQARESPAVAESLSSLPALPLALGLVGSLGSVLLMLGFAWGLTGATDYEVSGAALGPGPLVTPPAAVSAAESEGTAWNSPPTDPTATRSAPEREGTERPLPPREPARTALPEESGSKPELAEASEPLGSEAESHRPRFSAGARGDLKEAERLIQEAAARRAEKDVETHVPEALHDVEAARQIEKARLAKEEEQERLRRKAEEDRLAAEAGLAAEASERIVHTLFPRLRVAKQLSASEAEELGALIATCRQDSHRLRLLLELNRLSEASNPSLREFAAHHLSTAYADVDDPASIGKVCARLGRVELPLSNRDREFVVAMARTITWPPLLRAILAHFKHVNGTGTVGLIMQRLAVKETSSEVRATLIDCLQTERSGLPTELEQTLHRVNLHSFKACEDWYWRHRTETKDFY